MKNKSLKRSSRKKKTRVMSIRRSRLSRRTRRTRKQMRRTRKRMSMRGGYNNTTQPAGDVGWAIAKINANNANQASANRSLAGGTNRSLAGGGGKKKHRLQKGGSVPCCAPSNDYSYPCPAGMCGPIPQVPNALSQGLIVQSANIALTSSANAEFDSRVGQK